MQHQILQDIGHYIDFLRDTGFRVSICKFHPVFNAVLSELSNYEPHLPEVCSFLKSHPETRCKCVENKAQIVRTAYTTLCYTCCYAGVEEYLAPLMKDDEILCYVNVSGYRGKTDLAETQFATLAEAFGAEYTGLFEGLSPHAPDASVVQQITVPLRYMLHRLHEACLAASQPEDSYALLYTEAIKYMNDHYAEIKNTAEIAKALNYSPSYLRYVFSKQSGKTITEHLHHIRLTHAGDLLKFTNLSVMRIASACGFSDSNYFTATFRNHVGVTPTAYRRQHKQP